MGYFDGLANGSFKKDKAGNTVFFPWGALGRGRVLPDEHAVKKVRAFVGRFYKVSLATIIGVGAIVGWIWLLLFAPAITAWFYFGSKALISQYPYSDEKLTTKEAHANSALGHSKATLWLLFIASALFVVAGIWIAISAKTSTHIFVGFGSVVFFGFCCASIGYMLKVKDA